jgi:quercetin dioxygenase-like cupin family protein
MKVRRLAKLSALMLGFVVAGGLGYAVGQQTPPTETKGLTVMTTGSLDLSHELDKVEGRFLRLRVLSLEPGGVVSQHTHDGRPGVAYVLSGTLTEHRGAQAIERKAGDVWAEGKDVSHWAENRGSEPVVVVAADVFKQGM